MKPGFYRFARVLVRLFFSIVYPLRAVGTENLPESGAAILCCNHISYLDPLCLAACVQRPIRFIAKQELFRLRWLKPLIAALGAFPVHRGGTDMAAMRTALGILKEGGVLGIFPQGTRDPNCTHPMENGTALVALRSGAAVVPVRIFGPFRPFRPTRVAFGTPLDLAVYGRKCDSQVLGEVTQVLENAIWALQPGAK